MTDAWFTLLDHNLQPMPTPSEPVKVPTPTAVESAPLVTAKPVDAKPEPKAAAQEAPQSQREPERHHQEWRRPLPTSTTPEYIDAKAVAGMLGVSELDVIARSDFAGGTLPSIDTGVGRFYDRADVLAHLKQEADGKSESSPVAEALASGLYLQPARC